MAQGSDQRPSPSRRRAAILAVGLAIAYSPSYVNVLLRWVDAEWRPRGPPSVLLWNWLAVGLLLAFITRLERRDLKSIGLARPSRADLRWALIFWAISTALSVLLRALLPPAPSSAFDAVLALPLPVLIALIITTATTEEILFRGYPVERLRELTGSLPAAVALSFSLFVLPHVRLFGPEWLIYNGAGVVLIYVLYVWRRNLWACMTMHFLGNALMLLPATGFVS